MCCALQEFKLFAGLNLNDNIDANILTIAITYIFFSSNCEHLIASGKVDICVCKNIVKQVRNVSFMYKF